MMSQYDTQVRNKAVMNGDMSENIDVDQLKADYLRVLAERDQLRAELTAKESASSRPASRARSNRVVSTSRSGIACPLVSNEREERLRDDVFNLQTALHSLVGTERGF
jgi:hypothetical protein